MPRRRRPLRVESLESRMMLAADVALLPFAEGEEPMPQVAIRLEAADPVTRQRLESVHQGSEFLLMAYVEDLRPNPSGVYGAYFDLVYPAEFFRELLGSNALFHGSDFGNGRAGDVRVPGLVDELGSFSAETTPPGAGEQQLVGVRFVATQTGQVQFTTNPADVLPAHEVLLFNQDDGVPTNQIRYGGLTLEILPSLPEKSVDAVIDVFTVMRDSTDNLLNVLENDTNTTNLPVRITAVDTAGTRGQVSIINDGALLVYVPPEGFVGIDRFTYTITGDGEHDSAVVSIHVDGDLVTPARVAYHLEVTNTSGQPVSSVTVGQEFVLSVLAEDLRADPAGVFAAFVDVRYTSASADVAGVIRHAPSYSNGPRGDIQIHGLMDDVGGFAHADALGPGRFEVFRVPFTATQPGRVVFQSDPADDTPKTDTLLFGDDFAIDLEEIHYGRAIVDVLPGVVAVDDTFTYTINGTSQIYDVLANDLNRGDGSLRILDVNSGGLLGTVSVASDGSHLRYTPPANFGGREQLTYTIAGPLGTSTATVTLQPQNAASDDLLSIRLVTTDLSGQFTTSVDAGAEFLVQAWVRDLRGPGADRGVYAAYFDLLFEQAMVVPVVQTDGSPTLVYAAEFQNGTRGGSVIPGLIDELGAFQTNTTPLGSGEHLLVSARFRAASGRGRADTFQVFEDGGEVRLAVLENDEINAGSTTLRTDPADEHPRSDVLFYEPPTSLPFHRIRYGQSTLDIVADEVARIVSVSAGSQGGTVRIDEATGSLLYAPALNFHGVETFTYSLDGQTQIPVSVTVHSVNDAPVARDDLYYVRENQTLAVESALGLLANDFDVDGDDLQVALVAHPEHGELTLASDGSFTYVPRAGYVGSDHFTYTVSDGELTSATAVVQLKIVSHPVSIRLQAVDALGVPLSSATTGTPLVVQALVQDRRVPDPALPGLGAVYLDMAFDPLVVQPLASGANPLGFEIDFHPDYQNGRRGTVSPEGLIHDVGAFQSDFSALGSEEVALFQIALDLGGPRVVDDVYDVTMGSRANRLAVLDNEAELRWQIDLESRPATNSPASDIIYFDPVEVVPVEDVSYGKTSLEVGNGDLLIQSVTAPISGGMVTIAGNGTLIYEPLADFSGVDTFEYTVVDAQGNSATATVQIQMVMSWQNTIEPRDVDGDGNTSPLDVLLIVNKLNAEGPQALTGVPESAFYDVNGDGYLSPIDALIVINHLVVGGAAEGEYSPRLEVSRSFSAESHSLFPLVAPVDLWVLPQEDQAKDLPKVGTPTLEPPAPLAFVATRPEEPTNTQAAYRPSIKSPFTDAWDALEDALDAIAGELARAEMP